MFDFGLILEAIIATFSIISVVCIGIGAYTVLRDELQEGQTEKQKISTRSRLIR
jgi:hypothetical protein